MDYLLDYQKEILNCNDDFIIFNGCRNSGKTFILVKIIEKYKPKNVIFPTPFYDEGLEDFVNILERTTFFKIKKSKYRIFIPSINCTIECFNHNNDKDKKYDYFFYDDCLPFNNEIKANKIISTITINNYDKWIEKKYIKAKVFNIDYRKVLNNKPSLLNKKHIESVKSHPRFCEEYGILDKK